MIGARNRVLVVDKQLTKLALGRMPSSICKSGSALTKNTEESAKRGRSVETRLNDSAKTPLDAFVGGHGRAHPISRAGDASAQTARMAAAAPDGRAREQPDVGVSTPRNEAYERFYRDTQELISPHTRIRRLIIEVVYGPVATLQQMCQALLEHEVNAHTVPVDARPSLHLFGLGQKKLVSCLQALEAADRDLSTSGSDLTDCRDKVIKSLLFLHTIGEQLPRNARPDTFEPWNLLVCSPLTAGEIFTGLQIFEEAGIFPAGGKEFLKCNIELSQTASAAERFKASARYREAKAKCLTSEELVALRRYLRSHEVAEQQAANDGWTACIETGKTHILSRRLATLSKLISRQFEVIEHLGRQPTENAINEAQARMELEEILRVLDCAKRHIKRAEGVLLSQHRTHRQKSSLKRSAIQEAVPTAGVEVYYVDATTGERVEQDDIAARHRRQGMVFGQAAELYIRLAIKLTYEIAFFCDSPQQLGSKLQDSIVSLEALRRRGACLDRRTTLLLSRAKFIETIAAHLSVEEGADASLFERVRVRQEQKTIYLYLSQECMEIKEALAAAVRRADSAHRHQSDDLAGAGLQSEPAEAEAERRRERDAAVYAETLAGQLTGCEARPASFEGASSQPWQVASRRRVPPMLSIERKHWLDEVFARGTFESPVASCVYHWRKHGLRPDETTTAVDEARLVAYVEEARRARQGWSTALARGSGYLVPSLAGAGQLLRVISNAKTYLVMTDDDDSAKIVSYRNRGWHGAD